MPLLPLFHLVQASGWIVSNPERPVVSMHKVALCIASAAVFATARRFVRRRTRPWRHRGQCVVAAVGSPAVEVLYNDGRLVAVNKPSGLVVHRSELVREDVTLMGILKDAIGPSIAPVNRLDRGTSGIMLLSLDPEMTQLAKAALESKDASKTYLAMVRGLIPEQGVVDSPMTRVTKRARRRTKRKSSKMPLEDAEEVPALTRYRRLAAIERPDSSLYETRYSLVEVEIEYGRMHQIRRHLSRIAHPVIGDSQHGKSEHNRYIRQVCGLDRLALHACTVTLSHPITHQTLRLQAPLPAELVQAWTRLRLLGCEAHNDSGL